MGDQQAENKSDETPETMKKMKNRRIVKRID